MKTSNTCKKTTASSKRRNDLRLFVPLFPVNCKFKKIQQESILSYDFYILDLLRKYFLLQFPYFGYAEFVNRRHI